MRKKIPTTVSDRATVRVLRTSIVILQIAGMRHSAHHALLVLIVPVARTVPTTKIISASPVGRFCIYDDGDCPGTPPIGLGKRELEQVPENARQADSIRKWVG